MSSRCGARGGGGDLIHGKLHRPVEFQHEGAAVLDPDEHRVERVARQDESGRDFRRAETAHQEIQHVIRPVADEDVIRFELMQPAERIPERRALGIRIEPQ